jgi:hypothetical protein
LLRDWRINRFLKLFHNDAGACEYTFAPVPAGFRLNDLLYELHKNVGLSGELHEAHHLHQLKDVVSLSEQPRSVIPRVIARLVVSAIERKDIKPCFKFNPEALPAIF